MVPRAQLAHAAIVVVGLAMIGGGVALLDQPEYTHEVESVDETAVPESADAMNVSSLSPEGRAVVLDALESSDGEVAVHRDERVPEFRYGDVSDTFLVRHEGDLFEVTTGGGGVLSGVDEILAWVLLAVGGLAVLAGGIDFVRYRRADT